MGGSLVACASADISQDLCNAEHLDVNDGGIGVSMWVEKVPGNSDNWYLLLPSTHSVNNQRPIAIQLFHGIVISWDGRVIRHGSSRPYLTNGNEVRGCFFNVTER